ncbi:hypothetical protein WA556_001663, partial [Blastocystis sp. ATCC 50177/Nand II]
MDARHSNIVQLVIDNKTDSSGARKSKRRLFDVFAETKSTKDYTCEEVKFMYPEMVRSTITIEFQKEGHIFASTHGDHTVKIVDFSTGKILRTLIGHPRTPWAVRFHPRNPDLLVSGCLGSVVMVWNWKKNETLAYTQIMQNVMISSLDWHPTEEIVLITCGTAVYLWSYTKNLLVNLFPNSLLKYQYAFFYGDGKNFIASHENLINREQVKTFTICKYHLVKDKYTGTTVVYGCKDITTHSSVNCSNGIHFSKNGDYAFITVCEGSSFATQLPTMPVIPSATLSQLQYNRYLVPPNPPALPSLPPAHPAQAVQTVQSVQSVQTVQSVQSVQSIQPVQSVQSAQSSRIQQSTQQTQQSAQQSTQPLSNASLLPSSSAFSQNAPRSQHSSIFPSLVNQPPAPSTPPS